ncbi:proline-rich receptor-like protein kinase PERK2 [Neopelma chrysocephalum]|uniref:proline-rich receptor-like protein kinase PERK2 n=1 Tax=Neopelma chrysocephalum TaxID=114329 RepID=UPI000FCCE56D|nr:proline-rich receptor-like protein kinase PERK2 [Neopelma chrysocephalum]
MSSSLLMFLVALQYVSAFLGNRESRPGCGVQMWFSRPGEQPGAFTFTSTRLGTQRFAVRPAGTRLPPANGGHRRGTERPRSLPHTPTPAPSRPTALPGWQQQHALPSPRALRHRRPSPPRLDSPLRPRGTPGTPLPAAPPGPCAVPTPPQGHAPHTHRGAALPSSPSPTAPPVPVPGADMGPPGPVTASTSPAPPRPPPAAPFRAGGRQRRRLIPGAAPAEPAQHRPSPPRCARARREGRRR